MHILLGPNIFQEKIKKHSLLHFSLVFITFNSILFIEHYFVSEFITKKKKNLSIYYNFTVCIAFLHTRNCMWLKLQVSLRPQGKISTPTLHAHQLINIATKHSTSFLSSWRPNVQISYKTFGWRRKCTPWQIEDTGLAILWIPKQSFSKNKVG